MAGFQKVYPGTPGAVRCPVTPLDVQMDPNLACCLTLSTRSVLQDIFLQQFDHVAGPLAARLGITRDHLFATLGDVLTGEPAGNATEGGCDGQGQQHVQPGLAGQYALRFWHSCRCGVSAGGE